MDAVLGRKVLDHVEAHRNQFDMSTWGEKDETCGTTACIGGWALLLSGWTLTGPFGMTFTDPAGIDRGDTEVSKAARQLLALTDDEFTVMLADGEGTWQKTLFTMSGDDEALARLRELTEAAEAAGA